MFAPLLYTTKNAVRSATYREAVSLIKRLNLSGQGLIQLGTPIYLFLVLQLPEMCMITTLTVY